jgi:hypothetical protein
VFYDVSFLFVFYDAPFLFVVFDDAPFLFVVFYDVSILFVCVLRGFNFVCLCFTMFQFCLFVFYDV